MVDLEGIPSIQSLMLTQRSRYTLVASDTLFVYDYLLTLSNEIRFVWSSRWNLGKVLFLLTRYSPIVDTILSTYRIGAESPTVETCRILTTMSGWTCLVGLVIAEIIMLLRLWAMWKRSRVIGWGLTVLVIIFIAIGAIMYHTFAAKFDFIDLDIHTSSPLPGCHHSTPSNASFVSFLLLMVFEMFMLILTMVKGVKDLACPHSSFVYRFYQDGVFYYATLSIVSLLNVVMLLAGPPELATALVPPQRCLHSIFSSRILLRLREDASRCQASVPLTELVPHGSDQVSAGANSPASVFRSSRWNGENSMSWFGDARSNVARGDPFDEDEVMVDQAN